MLCQQQSDFVDSEYNLPQKYNELKWLLKWGGEHIFSSYDISIENTCTHLTISPVLYHYLNKLSVATQVSQQDY